MRRPLLLLVVLAAAMFGAAFGAASADARTPSVGVGGRDIPVLITADELSQDEELGTITARGNVEISQGERVLMADTVTYNQKSDTVSASGNITLMEPDGEVVFADFVELTDEFKNGLVKRLGVLLTDDSRFAAIRAQRRDGNLTVMDKAVYSPCLPCKKNPNKPPIWQLKAERVEHDQKRREIRYRNAFLEMHGVPVAYVPYFSHPDPTVERKSGFLAPDGGTGGNVGGFFRLPYFLAIGDDKDATISPIYTKDEGLVFSGEYRQRFNKGEVKFFGSVTEADRRTDKGDSKMVRRDRIRGHLAFDARYDFNQTWRAGANIERATDRTYLSRFNFFEEGGDMLDSKVYLEGFRSRNYAAANAYSFQDLRSGSRPDQPLIAPLLQYNHVGEADRFGGRISLDTDFRFLRRSDGPTTERFSLRPGYEIRHISDFGVQTTFRTSLRADLYNVDQTDDPAVARKAGDAVTGRLLPRATLDFRLPFVRSTGNVRQIIEPILFFTATPNRQNPSDIPDEDSTVFEADDTNLLSEDRLPGGDRVETGQRVAYGLRLGAYGSGNGRTTAFIGQSFRVGQDNALKEDNLIERQFSDVVGRIEVKPNPYIDMLYRFAFAPDKFFEPNRNEVTFSVGPSAYRLSGSYDFIGATSQFEEREELKLTFRSKLTDFWSLEASTQRDLDEDRSLRHGASLTYADECIAFSIIGERSFFDDDDIEPSDSVLFRLNFKHLGEVKASAG